MATLRQAALVITRNIYKDQLYDWIMRVSDAIGGIATASLGPFDTVVKASSKRLLDLTTAQIAGLKNGAQVWVESYKSDWFWDAQFPAATPTDNKTSCRPTAWVATGNPGAFVRSTEGDRGSWDQLTWHIATTGDDENDGLTALTPIQTDAEILRRWGPGQVPITKNVAIIWHDSADVDPPTPTTNFDVRYEGGCLTLTGVLTVVLGNVVLTGVGAQDRNAGALWNLSGPGLASHVGKMLRIVASATAGNVGAYATIINAGEGGDVNVSPFGTVGLVSDLPFTNVVPEVGDTVEVISFPTLNVGTVRTAVGSVDPFDASPLSNCTIVDLLYLKGTTNAFFVLGTIDASAPVFYRRCFYQDVRLAGQGGTTHYVAGGAANGGQISCHPGCKVEFFSTLFLGDTDGLLEMLPGSDVRLQQDCYFVDSSIDALGPCHIRSGGTCYTLAGGAGLELDFGVYEQRGGVPDWGMNNDEHGIALNAGVEYHYDEKPIVNAGTPGFEALIGGTEKLYEDIPYIEGANGAAMVLRT